MAQKYLGKAVQFHNEDGELVVGKVVGAKSDAFLIEKWDTKEEKDLGGAGYGFYGPRRPLFYRPRPRPYFYRPRPYGAPVGRYPYAGAIGLTLLPFLFW